MRSVLRQLIMRPRDVTVFSSDVNDVVADLVKRVKTLRSQQDDSQTVLNINDLFFKYAMEGEPEGSVCVCGTAKLKVFTVKICTHPLMKEQDLAFSQGFPFIVV